MVFLDRGRRPVFTANQAVGGLVPTACSRTTRAGGEIRTEPQHERVTAEGQGHVAPRRPGPRPAVAAWRNAPRGLRPVPGAFRTPGRYARSGVFPPLLCGLPPFAQHR